MDQTVNFVRWPSSTGGASLEMTIQSLSKTFGLIRFPNGAKAILSELEKCFAALPRIFPRISTESVELLIRMTICALQTQTTLDDDLRQVICRGATCLHDKSLAQELLQETAPQTLAQNSEWIDVLQQQNLQHLQPKDGQSYERINFCLENAAKFVALNPEAVAVFHPFLIKPGHAIKAMILLDTAHSPETKSVASLLKLDTPSTSTKMVEEISVPELLFTCDFCQKTFSLRKNFVEHIRCHSSGHPHKCIVCSKAFPSPSQLVKHIRTHTGEKPFACSFCDKSFSQKNNLERHKRIHTEERPYKCTVCPKTLITSKALVVHTRKNAGQKTFICSVCHKGFACSKTLKKHSSIHTVEKSYTCKFCQKSFSILGSLKKHERVHTGECPYKCNFCPKMFAQSPHLVVHTRMHTGEKPFVCSVCHRGFAQSITLKNHFRTHTGEKPFICDICNKSFVRRETLNRHKRIHTRKASDLLSTTSEPEQDGVPIAPSVSPSKQPSAEFVCNLPELLVADMSCPGSPFSSSLDMPLEGICDMSEVTPLEWPNLFLLIQDSEIISSEDRAL